MIDHSTSEKVKEMEELLARTAWLYEKYHLGFDYLGDETLDKRCACIFSHHMGSIVKAIEEIGITPNPCV